VTKKDDGGEKPKLNLNLGGGTSDKGDDKGFSFNLGGDKSASAGTGEQPEKKPFAFGGDKKDDGGEKKDGDKGVQFNLNTNASSDNKQDGKKPFQFGNNQNSTNIALAQNVSSRVKHGRLSDILDLWQKDFEDHIAKFSKQAALIKTHELAMMKNVSKMTELEQQVSDVTDAQRRVDNVLERLKVQQKELNETVGELEKSVNKDGKALNVSQMSHTQRERNQMYSDAEAVHQELINLEDRLTATIKELNAPAGHQADSDMNKLVRVLDNQMRALVWVDSQIDSLEGQIRKIESTSVDSRPQQQAQSTFV